MPSGFVFCKHRLFFAENRIHLTNESTKQLAYTQSGIKISIFQECGPLKISVIVKKYFKMPIVLQKYLCMFQHCKKLGCGDILCHTNALKYPVETIMKLCYNSARGSNPSIEKYLLVQSELCLYMVTDEYWHKDTETIS